PTRDVDGRRCRRVPHHSGGRDDPEGEREARAQSDDEWDLPAGRPFLQEERDRPTILAIKTRCVAPREPPACARDPDGAGQMLSCRPLAGNGIGRLVGCSLRKNRHGYLAFRLRFSGRESHEGTKLKDTAENRRKAEARARVIDQEINEGTFEYLRWFPDGNLAASFRRQDVRFESAKRISVQAFFRKWATPDSVASRPVSRKWRSNRVSAVRENILPSLGRFCLDELAPMHLLEVQKTLLAKPLSRSTIDGIVHSAFRSMLRAAKVSGYCVADLGALFDKDYVRRLAPSGADPEIDPYTAEEREKLLGYFWRERRHYYPFVFFRFWTGTRPSEAIALRLGDIDLKQRVAHIRRSRVLGIDGTPKTKKSRREVVLHEDVVDIVRGMWPLVGGHESFLFNTPNGAPIDE